MLLVVLWGWKGSGRNMEREVKMEVLNLFSAIMAFSNCLI